jgi:hypothetical protein
MRFQCPLYAKRKKKTAFIAHPVDSHAQGIDFARLKG